MKFKGELIFLTSFLLMLSQTVNSKVLPGLFSLEKAKTVHEELYDNNNNNNNSTVSPSGKSSPMTYDVIAAAAGYEALQAYERHRVQQAGPPPSHSTMQDLLAAMAITAVEGLFKTKDLKNLDKKRVQDMAVAKSHQFVEEKYTLQNVPPP